MTTGADIVYGALRIISSITPGEAIPGEEAANALQQLNELLAAFSSEWGLINVPVLETFNTIVGKTSYTIGPNGDFNTVRPDTIFNQWLYDTVAGIRYPIKMLSDNQYNAITLNTIQSIPKAIFYDPQYPLGIIYMYPTAGLTTYQLNIESYKPMMQFSSLTTTMNLPGEYFKALQWLLADDLSPEYGYEFSPSQQQKLQEIKERLKARNFRQNVAAFDAAINGSSRLEGGTILDGFVS